VCEHVDLPTVDALQAEWQRHPPVHHLVAAYLGYKPPAPEQQRQITPETDVADLARELGGLPVRPAAPIDTTEFDAWLKTREAHHG
jgi:hypothetical protein